MDILETLATPLGAALLALALSAAAEAGPAEDEPGLPRVLIIGDSISAGYTPAVQALLKGDANVHRIPGNGAHTRVGLANLEDWLGDKPWDVIHFNWGLHDIKIMEDGKQQVPLEEYERNLRTLVRRMQKTGATLVWCSTTPVPEGKVSPPRNPQDVIAYNATARRVMDEHGVAVDDLYAFALARLDQLQQPVNVHFTEKGSRALAEQVATSLRRALVARRRQAEQ